MDRPFDLQAYDRLDELARLGYIVIIDQRDDAMREGRQVFNVSVEEDDEEIMATRIIGAASSPLMASAIDAVYRFVMEKQAEVTK